jgi:MFS family permease
MTDAERQQLAKVDAGAPPAPDAEARAHRHALLIVFLVVVIDLLGFGIVLPILPRYAKEYLQPLLSGGAKSPFAGLIIGLLMSSFSAMQFVFAPIWGRISDRIGRRPILLIGLAGSAAFYTLFGVASEVGRETAHEAALALALLFVSRIGTGIAGATIATAQAVIADSTPPERRARGMALIGAAFGIGFTFGPLLGIAARLTGSSGATGFLAGGLSLLAFLLALRRLPETLRPGSAALHRRWLDWRGLRKALRSPAVGVLIVTFFLATFAFSNFEGTLSLLTQAILDFKEDDNYLVFAFIGVTLVLIQGVLYRRLALRVREVTFLRVGVALMAVGLAGLGLFTVWSRPAEAESGWGPTVAFLADLAVTVAGFALMTPSVQALISRRSAADRQGEILGVNQSAVALARILGPVAGMSLFTLGSSHVLPYAVSAALLALVFVLTLRLRPA